MTLSKPLFFLFLALPFLGFTQFKKNTGRGLYGTGDDHIDKGWFFGVGLNYMLPYPTYSTQVITTDNSSLFDLKTDYKASSGTPFGKGFSRQIAPMLEIGKFKMTNKKILNYMDYSISWENFKGVEEYSAISSINNIESERIETESSYNDHLISGNFNLGYRFDKNEKLYYVNGLGINLDYHFIKNRETNLKIPNNDLYSEGPSDLIGEIHYFFGIGFKTKGRLIVMPIIETPILALLPLEGIKSVHKYNNSRYHPILLKVRFMFLKKGSKSCPAVFNPMGVDPNGNMTK